MKIKTRTLVAASALAVAAIGVGGAAMASGDSGNDGPANEANSHDYTAQQKADATDAALAATGGGTANSFERDGENGATWEVEVTKPDGDTVDVRLDEAYAVVVIEGDSEKPAKG